jgi:hypothetical protein
MKSIRTLTLFLVLPVLAVTAAGCAGVFDKCVKPVASTITWTGTATELGEVVASFLLCDPGFVGPDVPACALESLNDLEAAIGQDGPKVVNCIVAYYESNGSAALQARAKVVGAKRGINVSALECKGVTLHAAAPNYSAPPITCEGSNCWSACEGGNCLAKVDGR